HIVCDKSEEDKFLKKNGTYFNNNNNYEKENGSGHTDFGSSNVKNAVEKEQSTSNFHPSIEALTAGCSEKILNPEYLLQGDGSPFVGGEFPTAKSSNHSASEKEDKVNGGPSTSKIEDEKAAEKENIKREDTKPTVILRSQKMKELKDLLLAEKLNTHAISLHLTAQSQVQVGKKGRGGEGDQVRPKRARRE
ncbi:Menin, partial [Gonioctena quinquepunctata]